MSEDHSNDSSPGHKPGETQQPAGQRQNPTPAPASPGGARPVIPNEAEILRVGAIERRDLARLTARKALADPTVLTPQRLARLGRDGLARFVVELRHGALGEPAQPRRPVPTSVAQPVASTKPHPTNAAPSNTNTAKPKPKAAPPTTTPSVGRIAGWWLNIRLDELRIDGTARRWGYAAGFVSLTLAVALILARRL